MLDLGEAPPKDVAEAHWRQRVKGSKAGYVQLRDGLRGRKNFKAGDLGGKTFDWCVTRDRSLSRQGLPVYKIWQVGQDDSTGFAIPRRAATAHSPHQMWNDLIFRHTRKQGACHAPLDMCGFNHPEVVELLELSEYAEAEASIFCQLKSLDDPSDSRLTALRRHGLDVILRGMASLCPSYPAGAFRVTREYKQFDKAMGIQRQLERVKQLSFVVGLVEKHSMLTDNGEQDALLALFSPFYSYELTQELFNVSHGAVERSRMFAAHEECKLFKEKVLHEKCRCDPRKFAYLS